MAEYHSIADFDSLSSGAVPYAQQTFLGLSVTDFNAQGGFGDSSSQLTVNLVQDELNRSDVTPSGTGHDVYWDTTNGDLFAAVPVGTPVFFSFGRERASTESAFLQALDSYYGTSASTPVEYFNQEDIDGGAMIPAEGGLLTRRAKLGEYKLGTRGHWHFKYGGILQAYNQTLSAGGSSSYQVKVTDPREILSDVTLILNGHTGSTNGIYNIMNVFGLLEHNPVNALLREKFEIDYMYSNPAPTDILPQSLNGDGTDMYYHEATHWNTLTKNDWQQNIYTLGLSGNSKQFPITGTGMSRRNANGIPYYRVMQAINTLLGYNGTKDTVTGSITDPFREYFSQGWYEGTLFRGLKYALDFRGLPFLSYSYRLNYDQINVLELAMEICEASNHELFVELFPIINHPSVQLLYNMNQTAIAENRPQDIFVGLISMRAIDKSQPSEIGAIQSYLADLPVGVNVFQKDLGYELTNETLDKLVVGGSEVNMYVFPSNHRYQSCRADVLQLGFQIIPYYGTIHGAATIPKGIGSYSQILLDASNLFAEGVGDTYVATEMELRAAAISYEKWVEFLVQYNDLFMESIEDGDIRDIAAFTTAIAPDNSDPVEVSDSYCITVPRCVWPTKKEDAQFVNDEPKNPCHPPYGWPLYWHRARNIGIPQGGATAVSLAATRVIGELSSYTGFGSGKGKISPKGRSSKEFARRAARESSVVVGQANELARAGLKNARTIHAFLKKTADECLGKKWLVKIPQRANYLWNEKFVFQRTGNTIKFTEGPFGFPPRNEYGNIVNQHSIPPNPVFMRAKAEAISRLGSDDMVSLYLTNAPESTLEGDVAGPLKIGVDLDRPYDVGSSAFIFNYYPETQGGFYPYSSNWSNNSAHMGLLPVGIDQFKGEDGRIPAYVRFDNSENLDFTTVNSSDFIKQEINITNGKINPVFINEESSRMEGGRTKMDVYPSQPQTSRKTTRTVHFVKVSIEEDYIIAPKIRAGTEAVYGRNYKFDIFTSEPRKIFDETDCIEKDSYRLINRHYSPVVGQNLVAPNHPIAATIDLDNKGLDYRNGVYALITVPGKIVSHISSAFREGMDMCVQNVGVKHILQADIVRNVPGFDEPPVYDQWPDERFWAKTLHPSGQSKDSRALIRKAYEGMTFCLNNRLSIVSPSPVYPDLAVLPLRSEERCYGPWSSLSVDGSNYSSEGGSQIGGKVEYVKDDSLVPWNYGGYTFMAQEGTQKCMLGTSAHLLTERGAFSLAGTPSGLSLCSYLIKKGPVITDINLSFDATGAAKTSYRMDSYTTSFGKMQKQRSDEIKKLSRLRKQLWDQRNKESSRRVGKSQKDAKYGMMLKGLEQKMNMLQHTTNQFKEYESNRTDYSTVLSPFPMQERTLGGMVADGNFGVGNGQKSNALTFESAMQTSADYLAASQNMGADLISASASFYSSGDEKPEDSKMPVSMEPHRKLPHYRSRPDYPHPLRPEVDDDTQSWTK